MALQGDRVEARLTAPGARPVRLRLALRIDASGAVAGTAGAQEIVRMTRRATAARGCCAAIAGRRRR